MLETLPEASEETERTVINNVAKLLTRVRFDDATVLWLLLGILPHIRRIQYMVPAAEMLLM